MTGNRDILTDVVIVGLLCAVVIGGMVGYYTSSHRRVVDKFDVKIDGGDSLRFVTPEKVIALINDSLGGVSTVWNTDVRRIEKFIDSLVYVSDSQVYKDETGTLHIEITPRVPRVRIISSGGRSFYIDDEGVKLPRCADFVADVPLVTIGDSTLSAYSLHGRGNKFITKNYNFTDNLINFAVKVEQDPFWSDFIAQININGAGEVELVPRIGAHKVILCDALDLGSVDIYLDKLEKFYFHKLRQAGWNRYRIINLKFDNLIVCTK